MSETVPPTRSRRPAVWVGGVLLVLAGLFGMHGLDTHGIETMGASTSAEMTSSTTTPTAVPASGTMIGTGVHVVARTFPAGMDMTMAGMCLAVLALALILLVALLRASPRRAVLWGVQRPGRARAPASRRTAPPPDLVALSVRRC